VDRARSQLSRRLAPPIEGDEHVRRGRRTAALTRLALGGLGIALILAQPDLLEHPELGVAGFLTVVLTGLRQIKAVAPTT